MSDSTASLQNMILRQLTQNDLGNLLPKMERVSFNVHDKLIRRDTPIEHVYFRESGQLSVIAEWNSAHPLEVSIIGREGMSDMVANSPKIDRTPFTIFAQTPGEAWRITSPDYARALKSIPDLADLAARFQHWIFIQASCTALAAGSYSLRERLARWLLMVHDRAVGDDLPLVHEFIATMLCVRRAGVTTALHELEGKGALKAGRGHITIINRATLQQCAGGSYGLAENEYRRLLGASLRKS